MENENEGEITEVKIEQSTDESMSHEDTDQLTTDLDLEVENVVKMESNDPLDINDYVVLTYL